MLPAGEDPQLNTKTLEGMLAANPGLPLVTTVLRFVRHDLLRSLACALVGCVGFLSMPQISKRLVMAVDGILPASEGYMWTAVFGVIILFGAYIQR